MKRRPVKALVFFTKISLAILYFILGLLKSITTFTSSNKRTMAITANFTEVLDLKKIKVLGYTTDFNKCDCCGKENLKGTISILDLNTDCVMHFGTTCAASADKYDTLDAANKVKKEINSAVKAHKDSILFARGIARRILVKKYGTNGAPEYKIQAPQSEITLVMEDCEKWYTNPENKFKAYPGYTA